MLVLVQGCRCWCWCWRRGAGAGAGWSQGVRADVQVVFLEPSRAAMAVARTRARLAGLQGVRCREDTWRQETIVSI